MVLNGFRGLNTNIEKRFNHKTLVNGVTADNLNYDYSSLTIGSILTITFTFNRVHYTKKLYVGSDVSATWNSDQYIIIDSYYNNSSSALMSIRTKNGVLFAQDCIVNGVDVKTTTNVWVSVRGA